MTKKLTAFLLAVLLLVGVTACGNDTDKSKGDIPSTTVTTRPSVPVGSSDSVGGTNASSAPAQSDGTAAVNPTGTVRPSDTTATPSTTYAPVGEIVPVGTKPATSTTAPTTTTTPSTTVTTQAPSVGGSSTGSTVTTTTTTATTTQAPTTTQPTEPPVSSLQIILPSIGSDIDVTNKKDRIRVSAHAAWVNEDGTIGIQLTFKNYTSNWITEEIDYIQYTCYDKDGKVVQKSTKLMIGVIDTKKNKEKTFTFSVPATTYEVRITKSKITYWTEWA